jgi:hypothetical protein
MDGLAVTVVPRERAGMATGIFSTVRVAGEGIALAVVGAALAALLARELAAIWPSMPHGSAVAQMLVTGNMQGALALMQDASAAELLKAYGLAFSSLLDVLAGVTVLTAVGVFAFLRSGTDMPHVRQSGLTRKAATHAD